ncbi:MAG TPA: YceI family protein [Candidatus Koribacter sp.]|jgi:polyisoprenoid-binding protein YceI
MRHNLTILGLLLASASLAIAQAANELRIDFDPASTKVEFTLGDVLHTVHGTFHLKSGSMHFDPATGAAGGLLVVDATSGNSGNDTRDHKMNKEILESDKFPEATFTPQRVIGQLAKQGSSDIQVKGIFRIHGADHDLTLNVPARVNGNQLQMQTQFIVPFVHWGMKDPSTFILRVNKEVQMSISGTELISGATESTAHISH